MINDGVEILSPSHPLSFCLIFLSLFSLSRFLALLVCVWTGPDWTGQVLRMHVHCILHGMDN